MATEKHRLGQRLSQQHQVGVRRIGTCLGCVALLGHLFFTLFQVVAASTFVADTGAEPPIPATCISQNEPAKPDHSSCPICRIELLCQNLLATATFTILVPWDTHKLTNIFPFHALPPGRRPVHHLARAPPSLA
ncbi:MAG: hypothetical protein ACTSUY_02625 [Alphaproteobacteria bacterium]